MATQVNLQFNVEGASLVDLRNQLKDLKNAMAEATDPEQMAQLAQAAGEVKDRMKDVNEQMNEMAAGSPFEKVKNNLSGMKQGLMDLDFDKVAASATNLATNASKISFSSATQGIKSMGTAFAQVGKALLTNPIFLIAAAIAAAVVVVTIILNKLGLMKPIMEAIKGIINQVTAAFEALGEAMGITNKKAEEAAKQREEAKKASKEQTEAIAKESSAYVGLVGQLMATKAGSKERIDIINQLNSQYGTTFKNLQDETAFQEQLNIAVQDYIKYKIAEYKLKANEAEVQKIIEKRVAAEKELEAAQSKVTEAQQKYNEATGVTTEATQEEIDKMSDKEKTLAIISNGLQKMNREQSKVALQGPGPNFIKDLQNNLNLANNSVNRYKLTIQSANDELAKLGGEALGFKQEMAATGVETEEQKKANEEAKRKAEAAAEEAARKARDRRKETIKSIKDQFDQELDLAERIEDKKLDLMAEGLDKQKALRTEKFNDEKDKILKDSIAAEVEALNKRFEEGSIKEAEYRTQLADLRLNAEKNLSDKERELLIGAQAQLDRDLLKMQTDFDNQKILKTLENNKATAKSYEDLKAIELQIIDETARQALAKEGITAEERTAILNRQKEDTKRIEQEKQNMASQTADVLEQIELSRLANTTANAKSELDLAKENTDEKIKLLNIYNQALIAQLEAERNAKLSAIDEEVAALEKKRQEAEAGQGPVLNDLELARVRQLEQEKANIQDEFRRQKAAADRQIEEETDKARKEKLDEALKDAAEYADGAAELIGMLNEIQTNALEIEQNKMAAKHAKQLEGLDEESEAYKTLKKQQALDEENLQKKIFEIGKKQQIAAATVQGIQAVLAAYTSGASLPGGIGVVMGPIFAAIAAGVAASNIARIKSTTFQGGGGSAGAETGTSSSVDTTSAANDAAQPLIQMFGQGNDANTETFGKPKSTPTFNVIATVSETDMTATQKRVAAMQANAEL